MSDWRLNGQEEYLSNKTSYKITFLAFWEAAYKDKNAFYQQVEDMPKNTLNPQTVGMNYLKEKRFSTSGMSIASSVGRRH